MPTEARHSLCIERPTVAITYYQINYDFCLQRSPSGALHVTISDESGSEFDGNRLTLKYAQYLLTNRKYRALHPQILEWGGAGFERVRKQMAAELMPESMQGNTLLVMQDADDQSILAKAINLRRLGYFAEAASIVDPVLARYPGGKQQLSEDEQWQWTTFILFKGTNLSKQGKYQDAIRLFEDFEAQPLIEPRFKANALVNKAAFFAETGQYQEALVAVDAAEDIHKQEAEISGTGSVAGSNREFLWIRACALNGLGKAKEAQQLVNRIEEPVDDKRRFHHSLTPTHFIQYRLAFCMEDIDAAVGLILKEKQRADPLPYSATVMLQNGYQHVGIDQSAFFSRLRRDPRIASVMAEVQPVGRGYIPSMNDWIGKAFVKKTSIIETAVKAGQK
jgi:tetratricopeptide (TPR) repeat protein